MVWKHPLLPVVVLYLVLAFLVLAPVYTSAGTDLSLRIIGYSPDRDDPGGPEWQGGVWRYWWFRESLAALLDQDGGGPTALKHALVVTGIQAYGNGFHLWLLALIEKITALPVPAVCNLFIALALVLNALGAWLLAREAGAGRFGSALAGAVFMINPYALGMAQDGRMRELILWWIPLALCALLRGRKSGNPWSFLLAGFLLGAALFTHWYQGIFAAAAALVLFLWPAGFMGAEPKHRRGIGETALEGLLVLLVALLVCMPAAATFFHPGLEGGGLGEFSWGQPLPGLEAMFVPTRTLVGAGSPLHTAPGAENFANLGRILHDSAPPDYLVNPWGSRPFPLIITLLALAALLANPRRWGPWALVLLGAYLFSLGPYLKTPGGAFVASPGGIRLPYGWFYPLVPFLSRLAHPDRAQSLVALSLAIMAGGWLGAREAGGAFRRLLFVALIILALGMGQEIVRGQLPLAVADYRFADIFLRLDNLPPGGVVEVPLTGNTNGAQFDQVRHHRPLFRGWNTAAALLPASSLPARLSSARIDEAMVDAWLGSVVAQAAGTGNRKGEKKEYRRLPIGDGGGGNAGSAYGGNLGPDRLEAGRGQLLEGGFRYLVLRERYCLIADRESPTPVYEEIRRLLSAQIGSPLMEQPEWSGSPWRTALFDLGVVSDR